MPDETILSIDDQIALFDRTSDNKFLSLPIMTAILASLRELKQRREAKALPPGFTDIDDYIREQEKDPEKKAALDRARERLRAEIAAQSATMPEPVAWCVVYEGPPTYGKIHSDPTMYKPTAEAIVKNGAPGLSVAPLYGPEVLELLRRERLEHGEALRMANKSAQSALDETESLIDGAELAESRLAKVMEDVPYLAEAVFGNWIRDLDEFGSSDFEYGCEYCSIEFDGLGGWPSRKHDDDCIVEVARKYLDGNGRPLPNTAMSSELIRSIESGQQET